MSGSEPAQQARLNTPGEAEERRLVEAAQKDRARFAEIYERYFELVYAYAARRVRERSLAEDLTSEVFHKALASLPRFKWTGAPFAAWLFRIAANLIADRAKREARESATDEPALTVALAHQSDLRSAATQQSNLEEVERRSHIFRLVEELPEHQRRVVALRFAEAKSIKELAAELNRSEGAIKQLQFRALQTLRARLATGDE